jgi:DNA-binding transcriptional ArsR family regulator
MDRQRGSWMTRADDSILEFLLNRGNEPLNATPSTVEANIDYGLSHIRRRLPTLEEAGLVEYVDQDRGIYCISSTGEAYLRGELDRAQLEDLLDTEE